MAIVARVKEGGSASKVRRSLERSGHAIGTTDSLIADTVIANGGPLLPRNRRHFEWVTVLSLA